MTDIEKNHLDETNSSSARGILGGDDPFLEREGKSLTWSNINMTVVSSDTKNIKTKSKTIFGCLLCYNLLECLIFFFYLITGREERQ